MGNEALALALVLSLKDEASKGLDSIRGSLGGLGTAAAVAGTAIVGTAAALTKLAVDAIPVQGIKEAFDGVAGSGSKMLETLRAASSGMVKDVDLMMNYNQAAMLVSKDFADTLPNAMQYLQKVSAATGQSMDFMMSSLVKGVGRVSPMILDNLGIQVSLEEATSRAAKMFGKEADALAKTEIQAGLTEVVMEKLAANTAKMPDVTGKAGQQLATFSTLVENLKDSIGLALLPVLSAFLKPLTEIANQVGPKLLTWIDGLSSFLVDRAVPSIAAAGRGLMDFFGQAGQVAKTVMDTVGALFTGGVDFPWEDILPASLVDTAYAVRGALAELQTAFGGLVAAGQEMFAILGGGGDWSSVWEGLNTAFGPDAASTLTSFAIIANGTIQEVVGFLSGLVAWFQSDGVAMFSQWAAMAQETFGLAAQVVGKFVADVAPWLMNELSKALEWAGEKFQGLADFIREIMPRIQQVVGVALQNLARFWEEHGENILRVISSAFDLVRGTIDTVLSVIQGVIRLVLDAILGNWSDVWNDVKSIFSTAWAGVQTLLSNGLATLKRLLELALPMLSNAWNSLWAALKALVETAWPEITKAVQTAVTNVSDAIGKKVTEFVTAGENLINGLIEGVKAKAQSVLDAAVGVVKGAVGAVANFLGIHSPSTLFQEFGQALMQGLAIGIDENKLEPMAAMTGVLRSVVEDMQGIMNVLGADMPEKKMDLGAFLDSIMGISHEIAVWMATKWEQEKAFLGWFSTDVKAALELWVGGLEPIRSIFDVGQAILGLCSDKGKQVLGSVEGFLGTLYGITTAVGGFISGKWKADSKFFAWFAEDITPILSQWAAGLAPMASLLETGNSITAALSKKAAQAETTVAELLGAITSMMEQVGNYVFSARSTTQKFVALFAEQLTPFLKQWNDSLEPLQGLLSVSKSILDLAADEAKETKLSVFDFFGNLVGVMDNVWLYISDVNEQTRPFVAGFAEHITPFLGEWRDALAPLQPLLSTVKGVLDIAANEVKDVKLSVETFFDNALGLMVQVSAYVGARAEFLAPAVAAFKTDITPKLAEWAEVIKPLQPLMSTINGVLGLAANEVKGVKLDVTMFLSNVASIMEDVKSYVTGAEWLAPLIASFKDSVTPVLEEWNEALKPLAPLLGTAKTLLSGSVSEAKLAAGFVKGVLEQLVRMMKDVNGYMSNQGESIVSLVTVFRDKLGPIFVDWNAALVPLGEMLTTSKTLLSGAAGTAYGAHLNIVWLLNAMNTMAQEGLDWVRGHPRFRDKLNEFLNLLLDAVSDMADNLGAVDVALDGSSGLLASMSTATSSFARDIASWLKTWGALGKEGPTDVGGILGGIAESIYDVKAAMEKLLLALRKSMAESLRGLYTGGYDAGYSIGQGFIQGLNDVRAEVVAAATGMSDAALQAIRKALGIASPSRVAQELGRLTAEGFNIGLSEGYGGQGAFLSNALTTLAGGVARGSTHLHFTYAPVLSLADEREARERIAPVLVDVLRSEARR